MYRSPSVVDPQEALVKNLQVRLKSLDLRIARMKEQHAGSPDPLAHRLIGHAMRERAEVLAKLPR